MDATIETDSRARILIVDNEPGVLDAARLLLELEGYVVVAARNGAEAWERLSEQVYDLLVSDFTLPVMSAEELVRRLRGDPRYAGIPVILTSFALPPGAEISQAVDGFLCKPYAATRLAQLIRLLLHKARGE